MCRDRLTAAWWCVIAGVREYATISPAHIYATSVLPRALLQCLFFSMLGRSVEGRAGQAYALVGSTAMVIMLSTVVGITHITSFDFAVGSFWRAQRSALPFGLVYLLRCTPWLLEAAANVIACIVVIPPLTGMPQLTPVLLRVSFVYLPLVLSTLALGMPLALVSSAYRVDVLVSNTALYIVTVLASLLVPLGAAGRGIATASVVPTANAVAALRAATATGSVPAWPVLRECFAMGFWFVAGTIMLHLVNRYWLSSGRVVTS